MPSYFLKTSAKGYALIPAFIHGWRFTLPYRCCISVTVTAFQSMLLPFLATCVCERVGLGHSEIWWKRAHEAICLCSMSYTWRLIRRQFLQTTTVCVREVLYAARCRHVIVSSITVVANLMSPSSWIINEIYRKPIRTFCGWYKLIWQLKPARKPSYGLLEPDLYFLKISLILCHWQRAGVAQSV
jgi:hypothetical protein